MGRDYRKIEAYQLANELAVEIYKITRDFPKHERFGIVSQMRRASVSIAANIAEGATRKSKKEYLRFLYIAKGSMAELECFINLSYRLGFLGDKGFEELERKRNHSGAKLYRLV